VIVSLNGGVVRLVPHLTNPASTLLPKLSVAHSEIWALCVVEAVKGDFMLGRSDVDDVQKSADEAPDASRSD
jgi:hypothetical protein